MHYINTRLVRQLACRLAQPLKSVLTQSGGGHALDFAYGRVFLFLRCVFFIVHAAHLQLRAEQCRCRQCENEKNVLCAA